MSASKKTGVTRNSCAVCALKWNTLRDLWPPSMRWWKFSLRHDSQHRWGSWASRVSPLTWSKAGIWQTRTHRTGLPPNLIGIRQSYLSFCPPCTNAGGWFYLNSCYMSMREVLQKKLQLKKFMNFSKKLILQQIRHGGPLFVWTSEAFCSVERSRDVRALWTVLQVGCGHVPI